MRTALLILGAWVVAALVMLTIVRDSHAQTTTTAAPTTTTTVTTTTTTTTTLAGTGTITGAVIDQQALVSVLYFAAGHITLSPGYATGGMKLTAANTLKDAGARLCGSPARVPVAVLVEAEKGGRLFDYDHTNRKIVAYSTGGTEVAALVNLSSTVLRFHATCK